MKKKNLTLFFEYFEEIHFEKDPFLVPYYLGKMMDYDVHILYPKKDENKNIPPEYRGVKMIPFTTYGDMWKNPSKCFKDVLEYLRDNAKNIDVLMVFFGGLKSVPIVTTYKKFNSKGKVYVKRDLNPFEIKPWSSYSLWGKIKELIYYYKTYKFFNQIPDVVSCETQLALEKLRNDTNPNLRYGDNLVLVPNGMDEPSIKEMGFGKSQFAEKDNIMLTVGRLGTPPKNTDMLLRTFEKVNFKDWKFYMVGWIDPQFEEKVKLFQAKHPELKEKVIWTGAITDRKKLYDLYNRSKVFVLSSRWEGFAIVFAEAQRFSNYVVTTPVGAYKDVIEDGKYGEAVEIDNDDAMAKSLQKIIDGKTNTDVYGGFDIESLSWENRLRIVAEKLLK